MATQTTPQRATYIKTVTIDKNLTADKLVKELGGGTLGNPIYSHQPGEVFNVTLTGKIEITEFNKVKAAYFLTKEGYRIRVNASFDPTIHTSGATFTAKCIETEPNEEGRKFKYTQLISKN